MAKKIRGNRDGEDGRNESYTIAGRGVVARAQLVREVKRGQHPDHSTYTLNRKTYVRANPNSTESDNVNQD